MFQLPRIISAMLSIPVINQSINQHAYSVQSIQVTRITRRCSNEITHLSYLSTTHLSQIGVHILRPIRV